MPDFIPSREAERVTWSGNFSTRINANPHAVGLKIAQAGDYKTLNDNFVALYLIATSRATRTPSAILAKDQAMRTLFTYARDLARIIQACPDVTDTQRSDLGLTVPHDPPTPVPVPTDAPEMDILSAIGRTVKIRLHGSDAARRGKPAGVSSAALFSFVGEAPPANLADWTFQGNLTRTTASVAFDDTVAAGAKVWLSAYWLNGRAERGPASPPRATNLPGGGVSLGTMRLAQAA